MTSYIGIDPGLDGGIVCIRDGSIMFKLAMPTIKCKHEGGKTKRELDREGLKSLFQLLPHGTRGAIEEPISAREQSVQSTITVGKNYGILLMALTSAKVKLLEVTSKDWHFHYDIVPHRKGAGKSTKEQAFEVCSRLYPLDRDLRKSGRAHKPHDGIVDALLIADYCEWIHDCEAAMQITSPVLQPKAKLAST